MGRMMGGGVESFVMNYYRNIDRDRVQFDFVVDTDSTAIPTDEIEELGGRIHFVAPYQHLPSFIKGLHSVYTKANPTIVHSHLNALSVVPLTVAKVDHIPVRIAHSHSTAAPGEAMKNIAKTALRPFARMPATDLAACSNHAAQWLFGKHTVASGAVKLVPNAIELRQFAFDKDERQTVRKQLGISETTIVIGCVGRLCKQKNQEFLLDITEELQRRNLNTLTLLVGDGDLRASLQADIAGRNLASAIRMLGAQSNVASLYQAMDVLVMPSRYEGLGIVAIEAQAANLPVVASDGVPKEADVTGKIQFLSLQDPLESWADALSRPTLPRRNTVPDSLKEAGYDIRDGANILSEWYLSLLDQSESNN
jgi:glycosyltransferase involved in cell wall biosynthesis